MAKEKKQTKKIQLVEPQVEETVIEGSDATEGPETAQEEKQPLVPEAITSTDIAIRVLISASTIAFQQGIFKEMNDVSCIDKAVRMCGEFINTEVFKLKNYNKTLVETTIDGKMSIEPIELAYTPTDIEGINVATVQPQENQIFFMFYNGDAVVLNEGDQVMDVFGKLVPKK